MNRSMKALAVLLCVMLAWSFASASKQENPQDYQRSTTVTNSQIAPPLGWKHFAVTTSAGLDTVLYPGFVFNYVEMYVTGTTCSLAVTTDFRLVAAGRDIAFGSDLLIASETATAYVGQAKRDSTYMPCPAGSRIFWGRASAIKVKGGSGTAFLTAFF